MGPSGGRRSVPTVSLKDLQERQEKKTSDRQYGVEVDGFLQDCLKEFIRRS